jgi:hypothetical protein
MSTNQPSNSDNQEIDLSQISKKIGAFFEGIATKIFNVIFFIKKNSLILSILFVLGLGIGLFLERKSKSYTNEIIVAPNFGSNDYLYSKIELINSKIKESDTLFLKNVVGIKNPKKFREIKVQPINDVYKFIDNKGGNFELIKLMAEDGDLKKIIEESTTSKNYPYHRIQFITEQLTSDEKTVKPLLTFLNNSDYYKIIQRENLNNIKIKIKENDSIINQIDGVLDSFSNAVNGSQRNEKLIYYNENTQLNDVIKTKNELVYEQGIHRLELVNLDKIVKENSHTLNLKEEKSLFGRLTFLIPFLFIFIYAFVRYFKSFYKKQLAKSNP